MTVHSAPAPVHVNGPSAYLAVMDRFVPAEVQPAGPAPSDAAWWALESARLAERRELEDYYNSISGREFVEAAVEAMERDLYQAGCLPC